MILKVIDNFLTETYHKAILETMTSGTFEWYYGDSITGSLGIKNSDATNIFNGYGFSHIYWHEKGDPGGPDYPGPVGPYARFIQPMLFQILDVVRSNPSPDNYNFIWRSRADMVTWTGKDEFIHAPHVDINFPNIASIFYVNESDGDTVFYNTKEEDITHYSELTEHERVSPKPNRLVMFRGDLLHTGCSPTKHANRILINSNFVHKEYIDEMCNKHGGVITD